MAQHETSPTLAKTPVSALVAAVLTMVLWASAFVAIRHIGESVRPGPRARPAPHRCRRAPRRRGVPARGPAAARRVAGDRRHGRVLVRAVHGGAELGRAAHGRGDGGAAHRRRSAAGGAARRVPAARGLPASPADRPRGGLRGRGAGGGVQRGRRLGRPRCAALPGSGGGSRRRRHLPEAGAVPRVTVAGDRVRQHDRCRRLPALRGSARHGSGRRVGRGLGGGAVPGAAADGTGLLDLVVRAGAHAGGAPGSGVVHRARPHRAAGLAHAGGVPVRPGAHRGALCLVGVGLSRRQPRTAPETASSPAPEEPAFAEPAAVGETVDVSGPARAAQD